MADLISANQTPPILKSIKIEHKNPCGYVLYHRGPEKQLLFEKFPRIFPPDPRSCGSPHSSSIWRRNYPSKTAGMPGGTGRRRRWLDVESDLALEAGRRSGGGSGGGRGAGGGGGCRRRTGRASHRDGAHFGPAWEEALGSARRYALNSWIGLARREEGAFGRAARAVAGELPGCWRGPFAGLALVVGWATEPSRWTPRGPRSMTTPWSPGTWWRAVRSNWRLPPGLAALSAGGAGYHGDGERRAGPGEAAVY